MIASIDIGTSYSSICILGPDGKARPVDVSTGASMFGSKYSLPSAVFVEDNGNILVGQAAMNSRRHKPQNFHKEFKRNLGEEIPFLLGERSFRPEELYTELFRHMKLRAEKLTGEPIEKAYLTYPASYGAKRREKLCSAAKAAGLFELELVDEPTAAAMCYCAEGYIKDGQTLLVYDFGGGTFDVSLIRYENGKFELLSEPLGLERCGGMDIDYLIAADIREAIEKELPGTWDSLQKNPSRFMRFTSQLNELAVKAKHHLSDANSFEEYIEVGMDDVHYQLTLERFNGMIASLVGQTLQTCRRALDEAGAAPSEISAVLMVGGTSRIPLVQEMARKITGKPALCAADLELAVAQGALMYNVYQESEQKRRETEEKIRQGLETKKKARQELEAQEKVEAEEEWKKFLQGSKAQNIRRAAEGQKERTQLVNGSVYTIQGKGEPKDKAQAKQWLKKAAASGDREALRKLSDIQRSEHSDSLPASQNTDQILDQLAKRFIASGNGAEIRKYLCPDRVKALAALKKSCKVPLDETILLAYDNTVSRKGSDGFIVTNRGIRTNNWYFFGHEIIFTSWQEFTDSSIIFSRVDAPQKTYIKLPSGNTREISYLIAFNSDVSTAEQIATRKAVKNFWHALHHYLCANR